MTLYIDTTKEKHIFDNSNYYYLDDFAKYQGFKSWQDVEFLECWNIEDVAEWSDGHISDWLNEIKNFDLDFILGEYKTIEDRYYISCVANLEYWNRSGQTVITPLEKITDIFNYGCSSFILTDIFEGENYVKFCISHHDGNDTYYLFFNEKEYNSSLLNDIENCILDGLDYDYYKPREKEYCSMIENIVNKYDTDYINSCVNIQKVLSTM